MNAPLAALDQIQSTGIELAVKFGPKLLVAILILVAGHYARRWVGRATARMLARLQLEPPVAELLVRVVRLAVFGLFLILALQNLGVELLPLIAGLGVAGAGIALAMQGVLSNVAAGLVIIFTRPFRVGEYIAIAGEEGRVENINLFSTTLGHPDLSRIVIPNRKIAGEILHNHGSMRQLDVTVGVAYDTDIGRALAAIREVLKENQLVLQDPEAVIRDDALADSSVSIAVKPWVSVPDYSDATGNVNRAILETFRNRGIVIPFPQREVRMLAAA